MSWWCVMRMMEKCLPRNDIVSELAPYLQHVRRDEDEDDDLDAGMMPLTSRHTNGMLSPGSNHFLSMDATPATSTAALLMMGTVNSSNDDARRLVLPSVAAPSLHDRRSPEEIPFYESGNSNGNSSSSAATTVGNTNTGILLKKTSLPRIRTRLGDVAAVRGDSVVLVQLSIEGFKALRAQSRELADDARVLYEHTVRSRLTAEYGGVELLANNKTGEMLLAFASVFHAAKWCLSLQLSLVYAAWSDKLLKLGPHVAEQDEVLVEAHAHPAHKATAAAAKKPRLMHRGLRVCMVIHTAVAPHLESAELAVDVAVADAVQWTATVSEYAHGGQIILSDSVWDQLKEQLVQLGTPVVEDLGGHVVLGSEVVLVMLLPRELDGRRFPKLNSPLQVSLGIREAPSALAPVTMVFTFIEGARPLVRCHAEELAARIQCLCKFARKLLRKHNGYECQELQGDFMLAFFHPGDAILWCSEYQMYIRHKFWEWDRTTDAQELRFSVSMGIERGRPASVSPHKTSGRADYFGNIVNQTARIAKAARGGQVLIGGDAWNAFAASESSTRAVTADDLVVEVPDSTVLRFSWKGYFAFKGISLPIGLIEASPVDTRGSGDVDSQVPKAKALDEATAVAQKAVAIAKVPTELLRIYHNIEKSCHSIRETEMDSHMGLDILDNMFADEGDILLSGSMTLEMINSKLKKHRDLGEFPPAPSERIHRI